MAGPRDDDTRQWRTYAGVVGVALLIGIVFALHAPDRGTGSDVSVAASPAATTSTVLAETTTAAPTTVPTTTTSTKAPKASATTTTPATPTPTTVDPGSLPQTDAKPTAGGASFDAGVQALWQAIAKDDPSGGQRFFFPRSAYLQVKAISDPAGDYQNRLLANFADDVHQLHAKLGAGAARAQFVGVSVPDDQAVWVVPGQEYNQLPYWRVYGTTLRYSVDGTEQSLPVTSLISWRGEWYVVHLGAIR